MENCSTLTFEKIMAQDVATLAPIMKRAFDEDTLRHLGLAAGGPPGYDNGDFLRQWYLHPTATAFKVLKSGAPIGAVNVFINANNENYLGNMFVDPTLQDSGVGTAIWHFVEKTFPQTKIWRTETPGFSKRNHNFYVNKCGFKVVKIENPKNKMEENYILEKEM